MAHAPRHAADTNSAFCHAWRESHDDKVDSGRRITTRGRGGAIQRASPFASPLLRPCVRLLGVAADLLELPVSTLSQLFSSHSLLSPTQIVTSNKKQTRRITPRKHLPLVFRLRPRRRACGRHHHGPGLGQERRTLDRLKRMLQGDTATTAATANAFISDHEDSGLRGQPIPS